MIQARELLAKKSTTRDQRREAIRDWARDKGYELDRYGNVIFTSTSRLKLGKGSVRYEVRRNRTGYIRLSSAPYGKIRITSEGRLAGLER